MKERVSKRGKNLSQGLGGAVSFSLTLKILGRKLSLAWSPRNLEVLEVKMQQKGVQTGLLLLSPAGVMLSLCHSLRHPSIGSSPLFELLILSCVLFVSIMALE